VYFIAYLHHSIQHGQHRIKQQIQELKTLIVAPGACAAGSVWLAANPSKRWAEVFFVAYSPFWIAWALCILVPFQLYEVRAD
jgi:hypothetical protein